MNSGSEKVQQLQIITRHARKRMNTRGISSSAVSAVIQYGRFFYVRGAKVYVIGRREVESYGDVGIDLSGFEGIHVVCSLEGVIITTYRNKNLRGLRPRRRNRSRRRPSNRSGLIN